MAFGTKTNERPGTRAQARHVRMSAYKAREVLDLIRGEHVADADEILEFVERDAAIVIRKVLASAIANAETNDDQDREQLVVSACYADEGPTMKRWRPRAKGRATRIRKRTCHITIIVSRTSDEAQARRLARSTSATAGSGRKASARANEARSARVAQSRASDAAKAGLDPDEETTVDDGDDVVADAVMDTGEIDGDTTDSAATEASVTDEDNAKEADVPEAAQDTKATDESGEN